MPQVQGSVISTACRIYEDIMWHCHRSPSNPPALKHTPNSHKTFLHLALNKTYEQEAPTLWTSNCHLSSCSLQFPTLPLVTTWSSPSFSPFLAFEEGDGHIFTLALAWIDFCLAHFSWFWLCQLLCAPSEGPLSLSCTLVSIHSSHANTQQTSLPLGPVAAWLSWMNSISCTS